MENDWENPLTLNQTRGRRYFTPEGEKPASDVWLRRWLGSLCDAVIVVLLGLLLFWICDCIAGPLGSDDMMDEYQQTQQTKIDFLTEQGIMVEDPDNPGSTLSDSKTFENFIRAYYGPSTLVNESEDGNISYNDILMNFYLVKSKILDLDISDWNVPTTPREYFDEILDEDINQEIGKDIFVFDEETQLPALNPEVQEGERTSPRVQLLSYVGVDPETGENVAVDYSDSSASLYSNISTCFLSMRQFAGQIAISDATEYANELRMNDLALSIGLIRTACVIVGWVAALIIYRAVWFPIFRYGRTLGKRVLGYYVADKNRRKAKWWQLCLRTFGEFLEQFWTVVFGLLISFSGTALNAPLFRVGNGYVTVFWFLIGSLAIYLASCMMALIMRGDMVSFHDLISHTRCIALQDSEIIQKHLGEDKEEKIDISNIDQTIIRNMEGE